jgi:hypothetical protein
MTEGTTFSGWEPVVQPENIRSKIHSAPPVYWNRPHRALLDFEDSRLTRPIPLREELLEPKEVCIAYYVQRYVRRALLAGNEPHTVERRTTKMPGTP